MASILPTSFYNPLIEAAQKRQQQNTKPPETTEDQLPLILSLLRFKAQKDASELARQDREDRIVKETHEELVTKPTQQRAKLEKERQQNIKFNQGQIDREQRLELAAADRELQAAEREDTKAYRKEQRKEWREDRKWQQKQRIRQENIDLINNLNTLYGKPANILAAASQGLLGKKNFRKSILLDKMPLGEGEKPVTFQEWVDEAPSGAQDELFPWISSVVASVHSGHIQMGMKPPSVPTILRRILRSEDFQKTLRFESRWYDDKPTVDLEQFQEAITPANMLPEQTSNTKNSLGIDIIDETDGPPR